MVEEKYVTPQQMRELILEHIDNCDGSGGYCVWCGIKRCSCGLGGDSVYLPCCGYPKGIVFRQKRSESKYSVEDLAKIAEWLLEFSPRKTKHHETIRIDTSIIDWLSQNPDQVKKILEEK